jgi:hypothetical protein
MSINFYTNRRNDSPGKRWQTTMKSSLEEVATKLEGNYDHGRRVKDLKNRKLANTKTSISFGNDKVRFAFNIIRDLINKFLFFVG